MNKDKISKWLDAILYEDEERLSFGSITTIKLIKDELKKPESSSLPEGNNEFLQMQFPSKAGSDIHKPTEAQELEEIKNTLKLSSQPSSINPSPYIQGKLATGTEIQDDFYPGKRYQNLFNYVANELRVSLLQSEMQEIISIVHKDFPSSINPSTEGVSEQDELWEEIVKLVEDRQFREVKYPIVYRELSSKYLLIKK